MIRGENGNPMLITPYLSYHLVVDRRNRLVGLHRMFALLKTDEIGTCR